MISQLQLSTLLAAAAILWAVLLVLGGASVVLPDFFRPFQTVLGIIVFLLSLFDQWLWKVRWLHPWFVSRPIIDGEWRGTLVSNWTDSVTGKQAEAISVNVTVNQTFSSLHMRLETKESSSTLLSGDVVTETDGKQIVVGVYQNVPRVLHRVRSPIHHGGLLLEIRGTPPRSLNGQYWTDRGTLGEMNLTRTTSAPARRG